MSDDIRLSLGFWNHPKTKKLQKRLGLEAIRSLQILWLWAAQNKPTGILYAMSAEDVELASDWNGGDGEFSTALVDLGWLEFQNETYIIHDWEIHQPWLVGAESRKKKAVCAAQARWNRNDKNATSIHQACSEHATSIGLAMPVSLPFPPLPQENIPPTLSGSEAVEQPKPVKQPKRERKDKAAPPLPLADDFAAFWIAYPRKVAKPNAIKAWAKLAKSGDLPGLPVLLTAISQQAEANDWARENGRYCPHPATWLNGKRWEDSMAITADLNTSWHKYRSWSEGYTQRRAALLGVTAEASPDVLEAGAKVLAEYIAPDGFTEDEVGRIISWVLSKPERAAHVPALANLTDEIPGWGMLITWASNGSRGLDVGDDPRAWRQVANG